MSFKPSRTTRPQPYNFGETDALDYRPNGKSFSLTLWPSLDCNFPTVTVETKTHDGQPAPDTLPNLQAWRAWREFQGEALAFVAINERGLRWLICSFTPDGKPVDQTEVFDIADASAAIKTAVLVSAFNRHCKPIDKARYSSKVLPINEETLEHYWTAELAVCSPAYVATGTVKQLRAAGINPKSFEFWRWVKRWEEGIFVHVIAEDCFGEFHIVSTLTDGRFVSATKARTLQAALAAGPENAAATHSAKLNGPASLFVPVAPSPGRIRQPLN